MTLTALLLTNLAILSIVSAVIIFVAWVSNNDKNASEAMMATFLSCLFIICVIIFFTSLSWFVAKGILFSI